MARWAELSYNRNYSRNNEIDFEKYDDEYVDELYVCDEIKVGLIEDSNKINCYSVEDVYNDLDNWN